jgi:hypothetical protein
VRQRAKASNALTRTFNPKVPGSRPGRPTSSEAINGSVTPSKYAQSQQWSQQLVGPLEARGGGWRAASENDQTRGLDAFEFRVYLARDPAGRTRHKSTLFHGNRRGAEMELGLALANK